MIDASDTDSLKTTKDILIMHVFSNFWARLSSSLGKAPTLPNNPTKNSQFPTLVEWRSIKKMDFE